MRPKDNGNIFCNFFRSNMFQSKRFINVTSKCNLLLRFIVLCLPISTWKFFLIYEIGQKPIKQGWSSKFLKITKTVCPFMHIRFFWRVQNKCLLLKKSAFLCIALFGWYHITSLCTTNCCRRHTHFSLHWPCDRFNLDKSRCQFVVGWMSGPWKPHFLMNWRPLVQEFIANIG